MISLFLMNCGVAAGGSRTGIMFTSSYGVGYSLTAVAGVSSAALAICYWVIMGNTSTPRDLKANERNPGSSVLLLGIELGLKRTGQEVD